MTVDRTAQLVVGIGAAVLGAVVFGLAARSWLRDLRVAQSAPDGLRRGRRRGMGVRPIIAGAGVMLIVLGLSVLVG